MNSWWSSRLHSLIVNTPMPAAPQERSDRLGQIGHSFAHSPTMLPQILIQRIKTKPILKPPHETKETTIESIEGKSQSVLSHVHFANNPQQEDMPVTLSIMFQHYCHINRHVFNASKKVMCSNFHQVQYITSRKPKGLSKFHNCALCFPCW